MKRIITHPGKAHRDDFLACCIQLSFIADYPPIERREPTEQELDDPEVAVLDIGQQYEPKLNNFDHHHFERDSKPECTFTLLAKNFLLEESFKHQAWYNITAEIDVLGPKLAAEKAGFNKFPYQFSSPIEGALLDIFGNLDVLMPHTTLYNIMIQIGCHIISKAKKYEERIQFLLTELAKRDNAQLSVIDVGYGLRGFLLLDKDVEGLGYIRDTLYPDVAFMVCHNDRGKGWSLYRYDDDPRIDFTQIKDDDRIQFAHKSGFIAKTKEMIPRSQIVELIHLSRRKE